nr:hypothetical protein [Mycoplasmopsis bovis]
MAFMVSVINFVDSIKSLIDIKPIGECKYLCGSEIVKVMAPPLAYCNSAKHQCRHP